MKKTPLIITLFSMGLAAQAQIPHAKTETVRIAGNCAMCKSTIETSASKKGEASASWDAESQQAKVTYDSTVTTLDDVLKRVAYAGYDNDHYLAPAATYAALDECCQYERAPQAHTASHQAVQPAVATTTDQAASVAPIYRAYAALHEALVAGKAASVPALAATLAKHLHELPAPAAKKAAVHATGLAGETAIATQRSKFASLSEAMYAVAKANPPATAVYYQHCPMYNKGKGANWLSLEKEIRNPYYGEIMLTCGSVVETLGGK